jgi:antitoxin HigA-1
MRNEKKKLEPDRMKNPPHPGLSVRYDCIEPLKLTIIDAAKAFGGGAKVWLGLQLDYDLAQARKGERDIRSGAYPARYSQYV